MDITTNLLIATLVLGGIVWFLNVRSKNASKKSEREFEKLKEENKKQREKMANSAHTFTSKKNNVGTPKNSTYTQFNHDDDGDDLMTTMYVMEELSKSSMNESSSSDYSETTSSDTSID